MLKITGRCATHDVGIQKNYFQHPSLISSYMTGTGQVKKGAWHHKKVEKHHFPFISSLTGSGIVHGKNLEFFS